MVGARTRQPQTLVSLLFGVCCAYLRGSLHTHRCIRQTDHTDLPLSFIEVGCFLVGWQAEVPGNQESNLKPALVSLFGVCCAYLQGSLHMHRCIRLTNHTDLPLSFIEVECFLVGWQKSQGIEKATSNLGVTVWCLLCLPTRIVAYASLHPTNRPHRLTTQFHWGWVFLGWLTEVPGNQESNLKPWCHCLVSVVLTYEDRCIRIVASD